MRVRPSLHINPIGFLGGRACDVISSQCRVKVPQNWKQHLRNDLNSVDGDVNTQHTLFVVVVVFFFFKQQTVIHNKLRQQ